MTISRTICYAMVFAIGGIMIACSGEKGLPSTALKELDGAERAMFAATSIGDSAAFHKLCGADYYTINSNGEGHTLAESLPYVPRFKGFTNEFSEQQERVFGSFVIRSGRLKAYMGATQVAEVLYTTGWVYRDGRWQFVHWQGTLTGMMLEPLVGKVSLSPPEAK